MKLKLFAVLLIVFCAAILFWYSKSDDRPAEAAEDEIALRITLDTKEDFGLLIIDYKDENGSGGQGGMSNANKSLLKHDEQLFYTLPKHAFANPSNPENLSIQFTVITEYVDPNIDNIYPAEYTVPMDAISLKANFGESYSIIISGDRVNGYKAVLEEQP